MGGFLTILIAIMTLSYSFTMFNKLIDKSKADIVSFQIENAVPNDEKFSSDEGFYLAAALTEYNKDPEPTEDRRYGQLTFSHYAWNFDSSSDQINGYVPIESHQCSDIELGFNRTDETKLYPVKESMLDEVRSFKKKFKCIDTEDLVIWGDYNSNTAQQLAVSFVMCKDHEYCKSENEIREWLKNKFIVLLYNKLSFTRDRYFHQTLQEASVIQYIKVSSQMRQLIPFELQKTSLELQDYNFVNLEDFTEIEFDHLFKLNKKEMMPYEQNTNIWVEITFERDLAVWIYERSVYTAFDMLSDVGGF